MAKQKYFNKFLSKIEPSPSTVKYISSIQTNLRDYLSKHDEFKIIHKETFLSGSYAKHTSIRPVKYDKKRDVDIVVVTNHSDADDSKEVLEELLNVLVDNKDYETAKVQSHSIGIEMGGIDVDVVPVIEADELYKIGSSEDGDWILTNPKGHKSWSTEVNKNSDEQYKPLVKIFKWWRRVNCPEDIKYPKGITLEKIIADNLGDYEQTTEILLIGTMNNIVDAYKEDYIDQGNLPKIKDPTVEDNDLLAGYKFEDFKEFVNKLKEHINLLDSEGTENATWRKILSTEFPSDDTLNEENTVISEASVNKCLNVSYKEKPIWQLPKGNAVFIGAVVSDNNGNTMKYESDSYDIPKGYEISYKAICGVKQPFKVMWQVVNTGEEALRSNCLRGNFEQSNNGITGRNETTAYTGKHFVQCFVIKRGICVAKSKEFIINVE